MNYVNPFTEETEYSYFSMHDLVKNFKITEDTLEMAQEILQYPTMQLSKISFDYLEGYDSLICSAQVSISPKIHVQLRFSKNRCITMNCTSCNAYYSTYYDDKLCAHKVAALLLLDQYIRTHHPGDSTDYQASRLLHSFRMQYDATESCQMIPSVSLIPSIVIEQDLLALQLQIGSTEIKRSYVVKNISELLLAVQNDACYALNANTQIDFSLQTFTEKSAALLHLLQQWYDEKKRRKLRSQKKNIHGGSSENYEDFKKKVFLCDGRLDALFHLLQNDSVLFNKEELSLAVEQPEICLTIEKDLDRQSGHFNGIRVSGSMPILYHDTQHSYFFKTHAFCRIRSDDARQLAPLLALPNETGMVRFCIGRKNLAEFYDTVLPKLRRFAEILEPDRALIESYLPPEVAFCFYLDAEEGIPSCRIAAQYGAQERSVLQLHTSSAATEDFRDRRREMQVRKTVQRFFPHADPQRDCFFAENNEDDIYQILQNGVPALKLLGSIQYTASFRSIRIQRKIPLFVGISVQSNLLDLEIHTDETELSMQDLLELVKSYRKKKRFYRLRNGNFFQINSQVEELSHLMEAMQISDQALVQGTLQLPAYRALYLDKTLKQNPNIHASRDAQFRRIIQQFKTISDSDFELPASLHSVLRSYQQFGYRWIRTLAACGFGGILADDMGLGKTLQMITVLLAEKTEHPGGTALVICPASLLFNWAEEFQRFAPELQVCVVAGSQTARSERIAGFSAYDVLITSYDLLKRDIDSYDSCYFSYQILDEAQYIKNHTTAASKAVKRIHSRHRFALTGTPIENRLSELWSIFDFLMPGFLYSYEGFKKKLELPIVKKSDPIAVEQLRRMTAPFLLRRLKEDVLTDLPEKIEETYVVHLENQQQQLYDAQVHKIRQLIENEPDAAFPSSKFRLLLPLLTELRQICCDPSLIYEPYTGSSAKRDACLELIEQVISGEHRVLLFSQFSSMLNLLKQDLEQRQIPYYEITGKTPAKERNALVSRFNADTTPVFLISLKAGGTGLNLTGADVVIHYDPWWNEAAQNQATDRAHRIGQSRPVTAYLLIAKHTIEERIQQMQQKKHDLAKTILSGDFVSLSSLTKEELLKLLQ